MLLGNLKSEMTQQEFWSSHTPGATRRLLEQHVHEFGEDSFVPVSLVELASQGRDSLLAVLRILAGTNLSVNRASGINTLKRSFRHTTTHHLVDTERINELIEQTFPEVVGLSEIEIEFSDSEEVRLAGGFLSEFRSAT